MFTTRISGSFRETVQPVILGEETFQVSYYRNEQLIEPYVYVGVITSTWFALTHSAKNFLTVKLCLMELVINPNIRLKFAINNCNP